MPNATNSEVQGTADDARVPGRGTLFGRIRRSLAASVGSIVFGMEDGTVSIFGLVFGVAAAAPDSHAVLLAGGPARWPPPL
jgi:VIT family protein